MTSATAMLVAEPWRCLWGFSPRLNVTCNFFSQNLWGKSANAAPFLVKKQKCQFDENKIDKKKPCLAPYRNSCKEISPSPSSIMLNLKKFHSQLHTPSWVDGTEKPNKEPNLCEKLLWQRVQSLAITYRKNGGGIHRFSHLKTKSHPVNFPRKKSPCSTDHHVDHQLSVRQIHQIMTLELQSGQPILQLRAVQYSTEFCPSQNT